MRSVFPAEIDRDGRTSIAMILRVRRAGEREFCGVVHLSGGQVCRYNAGDGGPWPVGVARSGKADRVKGN